MHHNPNWDVVLAFVIFLGCLIGLIYIDYHLILLLDGVL